MRHFFTLLLTLTGALAAGTPFSQWPSTNVLNSDDLLLLDSHLSGTNYATRTVQAGLVSANWTASGTTNSTLAGVARVGSQVRGTNNAAFGPDAVLGSTTHLFYPHTNVVAIETTITNLDNGDGNNQPLTLAIGTLFAPGTNSSASPWGTYMEMMTSGPGDFSGEPLAMFLEFDHFGTGDISPKAAGVDGEAFNESTGTISGSLTGVRGIAGNFGSGYINNAYGLEGLTYGVPDGPVNNSVWIKGSSLGGDSGAATNRYGILLDDIPAGLVNTYAIKTGTGKVEFGDNVQIAGSISGAGAMKLADTLTATNGVVTGTPAGGTAAAWKLGSYKTNAVSLVATNYIEVEIGGVLRKLAVVQ